MMLPLRLADSAWALPSWVRSQSLCVASIEPAYSSGLASLIYYHFAQRLRNTQAQGCKLK
jgi:hypothetical protein